MAIRTETVGDLLRDWRARRRLSQLHLAGEADVSARHLSFVESGRAAPSRDLLLRLAEPLAMPLRERNRLLLTAGYAPIHAERPIGSPEMSAALSAVEAVLRGHEPFPALALNRRWELVLANGPARMLLSSVAPALLEPPVNVLRASLHPDGLAPRIVNHAEWRRHLLAQIRAEADRSADPELESLYQELRSYPFPMGSMPAAVAAHVAVPLVIRHSETGGCLSFLSTTTIFGTATDVTLAELVLECFYPADDETRRMLVG